MHTHSSKPVEAYLSLGANSGNPDKNLDAALEAIAHIPGVSLCACSTRYLTEPQLVREQNWFVNLTAHIRCPADMLAIELLHRLQAIEHSLGKTMPHQEGYTRFGPRPVDIDLLLFGEHTCSSPELTLPHPRMHERAFVLVPLYAIAPQLELSHGPSIKQLLGRLEYSLCGKIIYQGAQAPAPLINEPKEPCA